MRLLDRDSSQVPVDGTSTWRVMGASANQQQGIPNDYYAAEARIVTGDTVQTVIMHTDNETLLGLTVDYLEQNNAHLPRARNESDTPVSIVYSTQHDIIVGKELIAMGTSPYVAAATSDGGMVIASGKDSVGTLKSIVFGIATSRACRNTSLAPLHASIGTVDGVHAFAVSGRGNWGKTTNMIAAKIAHPEISVVTDDWSMIDTATGAITPIDMMVAIRPEAVEGIEAAVRTSGPDYLREAAKDSGKLYSVGEVFGSSGDTSKLCLDRVLLTDKRPDMPQEDTYSTDDVDIAWRLMDDAYHSPDIWGCYGAKYALLASGLRVKMINTTIGHSSRPQQLDAITSFFLN